MRKVERSRETVGPVAGQENVYLKDIRDLFPVVGFYLRTNDPANISFSLKKHPAQVQSIGNEKHEQGDYKF